jgi:cytochrome P450
MLWRSKVLRTIDDVKAILIEAEIYQVNANVKKGVFYQAITDRAGSASSFSVIDRKIHARKRRILAPGMTDSTLATMEPKILRHIREFFDQGAIQLGSSETTGNKLGQWSANLADWANYMTFDVMADLTFGKELGMLRGESGREMPGILDANIYLSSVVGSKTSSRSRPMSRAKSVLGRIKSFHSQMGS